MMRKYINFTQDTTAIDTCTYANVSFVQKFFSSYDDSVPVYGFNLKEILENQTNLPPFTYSDPDDEEKCKKEKKAYFGKYGKIFPARPDMDGKAQHIYGGWLGKSGGNIVFIDLDKIDKGEAKTVFDNADRLKKEMPSLVAVNYSLSGNLHMYALGNWSNASEYEAKQSWATNTTIDNINKIFGFNWSKTDVNDKKQSSSLQRFPACYTKGFKWWDSANLICCETEETNEPDKWENAKPTAPFAGEFVLSNPHKIKIDKDYAVGEYAGTELRYRVANVILWYCKGDRDKAKEIINQLFYKPDEYYLKEGGYALNHAVKRWFDDEFGVIVTGQTEDYAANEQTDGILLEDGEYLQKYEDLILETIDNNSRVLIESPTGTGKTYLFSSIAKKRKCLIIPPFNSLLNMYGDLNVVRSGKKSKPTSEDSNVINWDQTAIKLNIERLNQHYSDFILVWDESHLLFSDRSYREKAIACVAIANEFKGKCVFITATPSMEENLFNIDKKLKFRKARKTVRLCWYDTKDVPKFIQKLVSLNKMYYDHICVFSDMFAMQLWLNNDCRGTLIHSRMLDDPENPEAKTVLDDEMLVSRVTYSTKYAYSGKNFRNKGKILVIINTARNTDWTYPVQAIGRMRNADLIDAIIVNDSNTRNFDRAEETEKIQKELFAHQDEITDTMIRKDKNGDLILYDTQVRIEINRYYAVESMKDAIIERLVNTGYIDVKDCGEVQEDSGRSVNKMKRQESRAFITYVRDSVKQLEPLQEKSNVFWDYWYSQTIRLANMTSWDLVRGYIVERSETENVMIDTILEDIEDLITCVSLPEHIRNTLVSDNWRSWVNSRIAQFGLASTQREYFNRCKRFRKLLLKVNVKTVNTQDDFTKAIFQANTSDAYTSKVEIHLNKSNGQKEQITIEWIGSGLMPDIEGIDDTHGLLHFDCKGDLKRVLTAYYNDKMSERQFNYFFNGRQSKLERDWKIVRENDDV